MNGVQVDIDPVIFQVGSFALRWYSLTVLAGMAVALYLTTREARRAGLNATKVTKVALWAIVSGVIGAPLFRVVDRIDFYLANPHQIIMVNQGGLAKRPAGPETA